MKKIKIYLFTLSIIMFPSLLFAYDNGVSPHTIYRDTDVSFTTANITHTISFFKNKNTGDFIFQTGTGGTGIMTRTGSYYLNGYPTLVDNSVAVVFNSVIDYNGGNGPRVCAGSSANYTACVNSSGFVAKTTGLTWYNENAPPPPPPPPPPKNYGLSIFGGTAPSIGTPVDGGDFVNMLTANVQDTMSNSGLGGITAVVSGLILAFIILRLIIGLFSETGKADLARYHHSDKELESKGIDGTKINYYKE